MFSTIKVGTLAPFFSAKASVQQQIETINLTDYLGKWIVLFFYPADFTTICPTEVKAFQASLNDFQALNTQILGCSTDSHFVHQAWSQSLGGIDFPLLADVHHSIAVDYNVFLEEEAQSLRGTFIISPDGILKWMSVSDNNIGRSVTEIKRVLQALQTEQLCPVDWQFGDLTLS